MPLSNAERQRRWRGRININTERRMEYLEKEKDRWKERKAKGTVKDITQMTQREKRRQRRTWRKRQTECRQRKKTNKDILTPPNSPETVSEAEDQRDIGVPQSRQKQQAMNSQKKSRKECYKENAKLKSAIQNEKRKVERYKKKYFRLLKNQSTPNTPRSKTRKELKFSTHSMVRKKLLFHNVMMEALRKKYKSSKSERSKHLFARIVCGNVFKKYRMQSVLRQEIGMTKRQGKSHEHHLKSDIYVRKPIVSVSSKLRRNVTDFYIRDDISRCTPGRKDTITRAGQKKQKRILSESMKVLFSKYKAENPGHKISYSVFCRLRPFWVVIPVAKDRETCLCKLHENTSFLAQAMKKLNLISTDKPEELVKYLCCDIGSKPCMYGECSSCKERWIDIPEHNTNDLVKWTKWSQKCEEREIKTQGKTEMKTVHITVKETITGTLGEMMKEIRDHMKKYKQHIFNIHNQYKFVNYLKQNMAGNECLIHVDFSENYTGKMAGEIQSVHFGASQNQITLHTGVLYVGSNGKASPFCTISDSLHHGPAAIWIHLKPILDMIQNTYPDVDTVHFISDGPTTQYRQKGNFSLFNNTIYHRGFKQGTWNFMEAGHGKGAPDGIGASIKRSCDQHVLHGNDIRNAVEMYEALKSKDTSVDLFLVTTADINKAIDELTHLPIRTLPGTMKVHQVLSCGTTMMKYRVLSCCCENAVWCNCYEPKEMVYPLMSKDLSFWYPSASLKTSPINADTPDTVRSDRQEDMDIGTELVEEAEESQTTNKERGAEESTYIHLESTHTGMANPNVAPNPQVQDAERVKYFQGVLQEIKNCTTFHEIREKCIDIQASLPYTLSAQEEQRLSDLGVLDDGAMKIVPDDIPTDLTLLPIMVSADGDCLPHSGSILAVGHETFHDEIRARIVLELATNKDIYLSPGHLQRGINVTEHEASRLTAKYAMMSDAYVPGNKLTDKDIEHIYEQEVLAIRQERTYMGIWQIFALASVLKIKLFSVYPRLGNPNIRADLHRIILPKDREGDRTVYIMWTTTRTDITMEHWVPNHFIPLVFLPVEKRTTFQIGHHHPTESVSSGQQVQPDVLQHEPTVNVFEESSVSSEDVETHLSGSPHLDNCSQKGYIMGEDGDIPHGQQLLNQYVVVKYDELLYPGKVVSSEEDDIEVDCAKRIGENKFCWPQKKDVCWYGYDKLVAVIPEPKQVSRRYVEVNKVLWDKIVKKCL